MITLADLAALRARHPGIEYALTSRDFVDAGDEWPVAYEARRLLAGPPTLAINLVRDDGTLGPLLDDLARLGVTWPLGRLMHVREGSPIAPVWGEVVVIDGQAPWRVEVSVHHHRSTEAVLPTVRRVEV